MRILDKKSFQTTLNRLGGKGVPFYFLSNFEVDRNVVFPGNDLSSTPVRFRIRGHPDTRSSPSRLVRHPVSRSDYSTAFRSVMNEIRKGNTFLTNLTMPSRVETPHSLEEVFEKAHAPFKILWKDKFVVFSPEIFVEIRGDCISSHPMKGTIDAGIADARNKLLSSPKETAEHATIVDLIRNDLSMSADEVRVEKFKYLQKIRTHDREIWQMSSRITGRVAGFQSRIGDILVPMLPAGSVSGAPKSATLDIIRRYENYDRDYYCGIGGYFDGNDHLISFVLIRFLEKNGKGYIYKSGGGITHMSNEEDEYRELIHKIYVPFY